MDTVADIGDSLLLLALLHCVLARNLRTCPQVQRILQVVKMGGGERRGSRGGEGGDIHTQFTGLYTGDAQWPTM